MNGERGLFLRAAKAPFDGAQNQGSRIWVSPFKKPGFFALGNRLRCQRFPRLVRPPAEEKPGFYSNAVTLPTFWSLPHIVLESQYRNHPVAGEIKGDLLVNDRHSAQNTSRGLRTAEGTGGWNPAEDADSETKSEGDGAFLFENVPPGTYVLAAKFGSSLYEAPTYMRGDDGIIVIEVGAGKTADLGTIPVERP